LHLIVKVLYYFILNIFLLLLDFLYILNINKYIYRSTILFSIFNSLFFLIIYNLEYINNKVELYFLSFVYYIFNFRYCIEYIVEYSINIVLIINKLKNLFVRLRVNNKFKYNNNWCLLKIQYCLYKTCYIDKSIWLIID
jgi:hypothetical protein